MPSENPFFVVTGTPRSRTAWVARFLTHGPVVCHHEPSIAWHSKDEMREFVRQPNIGASDSAMVLLWREIAEANPEARFALVIRSHEDVIASLARVGVPTPDLLPHMQAMRDLALSGRALVLRYDELATQRGCAALFRHCHGRRPPVGWYARWRNRHIECDVPAQIARAEANREGLRAVYAEIS